MTGPDLQSAARVDARQVFAYDAFIVHASGDRSFVEGYLIPELGIPRARILVLDSLELGRYVIDEIARGVTTSRVTVVVLSSASSADRWVHYSKQLAAYASIASQDGPRGVLLPLLLNNVEPPGPLDPLVKLDFRDPALEAWAAQTKRLHEYLERPVVVDAEPQCPYPGPAAFTAAQAAWFSGRDTELDDLIGRLQRHEREIFVVGVSGAGKSSLIAAGLVPRLVDGVVGLPRFVARTIDPGGDPLAQLGAALEGDAATPSAAVDRLLARHAPATALVLVVDPLDELFRDAGADAQAGFLAALRTLRADRRCVLVHGLRADFEGELRASALWNDIGGRISRLVVGTLSADRLRAAIEEPARKVQLYLDDGLVERLVHDAGQEPGALAVLQDSLVQLWARRRRRLLSLAAYTRRGEETSNGLARVMADRADTMLRGMTEADEASARRILLRLVVFGDGRGDTRRQQARTSLGSMSESTQQLEVVLQRLVAHRLVTVGWDDEHREARVDLAHEALILGWPTYVAWIATWKVHERQRRDIEAAAQTWHLAGGDDAGRLDARGFADAKAWQAHAAVVLGQSATLIGFLASGRSHERTPQRRGRWLPLTATLCVLLVAWAVATWTRPIPPRPAATRGMVRFEATTVRLGDFASSQRPGECASLKPETEDCAALAHPEQVVEARVAAFELDAHEVTNSEYAAWLNAHRELWTVSPKGVVKTQREALPLVLASENCKGGLVVARDGGIAAGPDKGRWPVVCVTWSGANEYCLAQPHKRLPLETEWELAAKGAERRPFPWGTDLPRKDGVAFDLRDSTMGHPRDVESSPQDVTPNGVHDLGGNVAEWVDDTRRITDVKMMRGGSWGSVGPCHVLGSGCRRGAVKVTQDYSWGPDDGFRCASSVIQGR